MKIALLSLLFTLCSCASTAFVSAGPTRLDHASHLDSSDASAVAVGFTTQPDPMTGFVGVASVGYEQGSLSVGGFDVDTERASVKLGVRYPFSLGTFRPYLGAGVSPQYMRFRDSAGEDENSFAVCGYAEAGIDVMLSKRWLLGLCYQQTFASDFDIGDAKHQDLDEGSLAIVLSFGL